MKKILTIALFTICGISNAALNPSLSNALTQPFYDNSTAIATDSFVHTSIAASNASVVLSGLTGGTYNTASLGSGALLVYGSSAGVVTSIVTIAAAGTGYAVGDIIALAAGNHDAQILVTAVSSGGITAAAPIYGGTGYAIYGGANAVSALLFFPDIVTFTGALTSNVTFVLPAMGRQLGSKQYIVNNNTTGAYTGTVCLTNGAGGTMGTCAVVPQGAANSAATLLETDGTTGIWLASQVAQTVSGSAQPNITSVGTLTGLTTSAAINVNGFSIGNGGGTDNNSVWIGRLTASAGNTGTYNTVIGKQAASMLANGGNNTLIGAYAGGPITSGYGNSTLGANTLGSNTTGSYITAIGYISGGSGANANITGGYNTWLGALSGPGTTTQLTNSTAIGYGALNLNSNEMVLGNANLTSVITSASISAGGALKHFQQEIDASYTYNTPTTGQTVALASGTETAIINPSGTLAALTVTLPSCTSGYDGSIARFGIEQIITALTVNTTSGSVVGAATASTAGQGQAYICRGALTTWLRIN